MLLHAMIASLLTATPATAAKAAPEPAPAAAPAPAKEQAHPKGDWVVVVTDVASGLPVRCWQLIDTAFIAQPPLAQLPQVLWQDAKNGHIVHVAPGLLAIQVNAQAWESAFALAEMTEAACKTLEDRRVTPAPPPAKASKKKSDQDQAAPRSGQATYP